MATKTQSMCGKTFVVRIYHTEHGTWQGQIGQIQTGQMKSFQSCLEMIKIIDEYLDHCDQKKGLIDEEEQCGAV